MHIPKLLAVFSLAAFCAGSLHAQKPDTDLQAQAREQLRKAMSQGDLQTPPPAQSNAMPAVVAKPPVQPPTKPVPVVTAPAAVAQPPSQLPGRPQRQPAISSDEQMKKMELQRDEALKRAGPVTNVLPTTPIQPPPPVSVPMSKPMQTMPAVTPANTLSAEEQEKARETMRKAMEDLDAKQKSMPVVTAPPTTTKPVVEPKKIETKPPVMAAPATVKTAPPVVKTTSPSTPTPPPAVKTAVVPTPAVAMPAAGSKDARLAELLEQYKAGSINPMEYQEKRAKIRAEPDKQ